MTGQRHRALLLGCMASLLTACVQGPRPLYYWGGYQTAVYDHFKAEGGPEKNIALLEKDREAARSKGLPLPPGYHAHLGMLYAETGQMERFVEEVQTEKAQFPESGPYMDFLMRNLKP
ncbi:MAG: DUF4810 domain-containing protein [Zoogloeaceae bacterium]|nr:DUF4810 domain-containing protein [Zoogloeaceae bacterium]